MPFEYQELTEADKQAYPNLMADSDLNQVKAWYIDKSKNICIWGGMGHWQEIAEGDYRWFFKLGINDQWFKIILLPKEYHGQTYKDVPYYYGWQELIEVKPEDLHGMTTPEFITVLKEALTAWGGGGHDNTTKPNYIVEFNF